MDRLLCIQKEMRLRAWIVVLFLAMLIPLAGCDKSSEKERVEARKALGRLGILYSRQDFMESLRKGDPLTVDLFLAAGMDPDERDKGGVTPLMRFTMEGNIDAVQRLIDKGAEVNVKDNHGYTALMGAAGYGRTAIAQLLIDKGAEVNAKAHDGGTALIQAALNGYPNTVKLLIDKGAEVNAKTKSGKTALSYAEDRSVGFLGREGHPEVVNLLRQAGAKE